MKLDFVKNTKRMLVAILFSNVIGTILPFVRKTVFMWVLGSEYLGLNGLFYSVLGMLMLAEMGFGTAIVCCMYKPVAEDNHDMFCAYLRFFRTIYRFVGSFIFIAGLCLLPFLRSLIHGNIPPDINLHVLYLMFLTNSAVGYFFFAYRGSILTAYHRKDIATHLGTIMSIIEIAAACLVLYFTRNYYLYVIVIIARTIINNLLVMVATKIYFPGVEPKGQLPKEEVRRILSDSISIFMHKIGAVISGSFDSIVISSFLGLSAVATFGNYSHIRSSVGGFIGGLCYSMSPGVGNKIYTESREDNFQFIMKINRIFICIIIWSAAMLLALYQPFMLVWTRKDPTLIRHFITPLLMVIWFYEKQSRETLRMFKNAASLWKQDRWKAVISSFANLAMNLTFIQVLPDGYKLDGVILASVIADVVIQMPWESYAVFTAFFTRKEAVIYWRKQVFYFVFALLVCSLTWYATYVIPLDGLYGLATKGCAAVAVSSVLTAIVFYNEIRFILDKILSKVR